MKTAALFLCLFICIFVGIAIIHPFDHLSSHFFIQSFAVKGDKIAIIYKYEQWRVPFRIGSLLTGEYPGSIVDRESSRCVLLQLQSESVDIIWQNNIPVTSGDIGMSVVNATVRATLQNEKPSVDMSDILQMAISISTTYTNKIELSKSAFAYVANSGDVYAIKEDKVQCLAVNGNTWERTVHDPSLFMNSERLKHLCRCMLPGMLCVRDIVKHQISLVSATGAVSEYSSIILPDNSDIQLVFGEINSPWIAYTTLTSSMAVARNLVTKDEKSYTSERFEEQFIGIARIENLSYLLFVQGLEVKPRKVMGLQLGLVCLETGAQQSREVLLGCD